MLIHSGKLLLVISIILIAFSGTLTAQARQQNYENVSIQSIPINDHIFMLKGAGGNIGVIKGDGRTILVDTQFAPLGDKHKSAIRQISTHPVTHIINTHYHSDHSGGNENWVAQDVTFIAHEQTLDILRTALQSEQSENLRLPRLSNDALPFLTFSERLSMNVGTEQIDVVHYPNAHTRGDAVVFYTHSNVIQTGDLYFVGVTPFIDTENGGTYEGYLAAMRAILDRADEQTKIIPGHGKLANKAMMQRDYERLLEFDPTTLD